MLGYPPDTVWVRYGWRVGDLPVEAPPVADARASSTAFGPPGSANAVAVDTEGAPIGCSGVAVERETGQNLFAGICVLPSHQRRGLGRRLLWESLRRLGDLGVERPRVYAELGAVSDLHVCPNFRSNRTPGCAHPPPTEGSASGGP